MKGLAKPKVTASATKAVGSSIAAPNLNAVPVNPNVANFLFASWESNILCLIWYAWPSEVALENSSQYWGSISLLSSSKVSSSNLKS